MNKEIKEAILEAVKLGGYKKANMRLKIEDSITNEASHCIIGILCELYLTAHPEASWNVRGPDTFDQNKAYMEFYDGKTRTTVAPTEKVKEWAGMNDTEVASLMKANDLSSTDEGYSKCIEVLESL